MGAFRSAVALLAVLLLAGCGAPAGDGTASTPATPSPPADTGLGSAPPAPPPAPAVLPRFGVAMSPASDRDPAFTDFFVEAKQTGRLLLWSGDADVLADTLGPADTIGTIAKRNGLAYGVQVGFHREGRAFDEAARQKATGDVLGFVERAKPAFLVLGVELDLVEDKDPAFIDAFAPWYAQMYPEIKAISPGTYVFPSFQLENVRGLQGGLLSPISKSPEQWALVDRFPQRDLTAFTTYPSLLYNEPLAIPADYYAGLDARFEGPIGFTEVAWHAGASPAGWETSPEEQAEFLERFLADADGIDAKMIVWLHLHDQPRAEPLPFQSMGLVAADGAKRPAYDVWTRAVAQG